LLHTFSRVPKDYERVAESSKSALRALSRLGPTSVSRNVQKMTHWRAEKLHSTLEWVSVRGRRSRCAVRRDVLREHVSILIDPALQDGDRAIRTIRATSSASRHEPRRNRTLPLVMSRCCSIIRAVSKEIGIGAKQRSRKLGLAHRPIRRTTGRSSKDPDPGRNK
jgi:hypothetical protein